MLAAAIVLGVDAVGLRWFGPWDTIADEAGSYDPRTLRRGLDYGIAHDRQELDALASAPLGQTRAVVVGSSRVAVGLDPRRMRAELPGVSVAKLGHAGLDAFVIRSMVDDLIALSPDIAVFLLSEYDTHRPVRIEPLPGKSSADLGAFLELARLVGGDFLLDDRQAAYRLVASATLESYRYRSVLARTRLARLQEFALPPRLEPTRRAGMAAMGDVERPPVTYWDGELRPPSGRTRKQILAHFPGHPRGVGLSMIVETTTGDHARVNMALLEDAFARLRASGIAVVVVEGPIHPAARLAYDPQTTEEFRAFAEGLDAEQTITFLPLAQMPDFPAEHFNDLLHLTGTGVVRLTRVFMRAISEALPPAS